MALLQSNGQLKTERYGDTAKGCQKPAVQQKTTDDDDDEHKFIFLFNLFSAPRMGVAGWRGAPQTFARMAKTLNAATAE